MTPQLQYFNENQVPLTWPTTRKFFGDDFKELQDLARDYDPGLGAAVAEIGGRFWQVVDNTTVMEVVPLDIGCQECKKYSSWREAPEECPECGGAGIVVTYRPTARRAA